MLSKAATQLQLLQSNEVSDELFDHVVFCANVTYADGGFKGGKLASLLGVRLSPD